MRIVCPSCHAGETAREYAVRLTDGSAGSATVVATCQNCKGTGWVTHPGTFKPVPGPGRGDAHEEAWSKE